MGVVLSRYEQRAAFGGDHAAALAALHDRLAVVQLAQLVHGGRAIVLFDGWQGSGRRAALKLLASALSTHVAWQCMRPARTALRTGGTGSQATGRGRLAAGQTSIFLGSWHTDAIEARLGGGLGDKEWARTCDEINEFEAQQTDHGTALFFHVSPHVQAARLSTRAADPWLRWTMRAEEAGGAAARDCAEALWEQLLTRTDTRWAGWTIIEGSDEASAGVAALEAIARGLEKGRSRRTTGGRRKR